MKALLSTDFSFEDQKARYQGKVRDVYSIGDDYLVMVATDRISAFDVVLPEGIPYKGQVLNQIASKFLDATSDIIPNWKIAEVDPMATVGYRCEPFKVEMVVRGYLTGHAWREYKAGRRSLCGFYLFLDGKQGAALVAELADSAFVAAIFAFHNSQPPLLLSDNRHMPIIYIIVY